MTRISQLSDVGASLAINDAFPIHTPADGGTPNKKVTASGIVTFLATQPLSTSRLIVTGSTVPTNGVYLPGANSVGIATNGVERMRFGGDGRIGIGGGGDVNTLLAIQGDLTGGINRFGYGVYSTVQSGVTFDATGHRTVLSVADAVFTLGNLRHFVANQGTIGASATVTSQVGFVAGSNLTGAVNNYGFLGSIASATGRWNFYAGGTAPNYFAGDVRSNTALASRTVPANSNATATATATSLRDGIRTGTPTANIDLQVPTGTNVDAAFQDLETNMAFVWSVINLAAATHVITVTANTDHTVVGSMAVAAATSGRFTTRKTAANTFITYRIG